jgi:DNA-binding NtrC family response regulator
MMHAASKASNVAEAEGFGAPAAGANDRWCRHRPPGGSSPTHQSRSGTRIVGESVAVSRVLQQIERVAPTSATVLIAGESGTGKELAALAIHERSPRASARFLPLNCGAVSPQLIESELFGHEKGSFTGADRQRPGVFECADGGTLFLDEVSEMPPEAQVKLLRVLETRSFMRVGGDASIRTDVRLIAATNRSPQEAIADGRLRLDLLYRLDVFRLQLPPLRERPDDIEILAGHFLAELNRDGGTCKRFTDAAIEAMRAYRWPGNVRELKNHVQRAYLLADGEIDLPPASTSIAAPVNVRVGSTLEEARRHLIEATLKECGNSKRKAAELLGISLRTLYNRLHAVAAAGPASAQMPT